MALHEYELNGLRYQFDDDDVPAGAKRVDAPKQAPKKVTQKAPAAKKAPAARKARTPRNKAVKPAANKAPESTPDAASDPGASE